MSRNSVLHTPILSRNFFFRFFVLLFVSALTGCTGGKPEVILYSDVDRSIVEPIAQAFEREKKIAVTVTYATPEDLKDDSGLSRRVRDETSENKIDLYLAQSPLSVQKLTTDEMLENVSNTTTVQVAPAFREAEMHWVGIRTRVRVLIFRKKQRLKAKIPLSIAAMTRPEWKGRVAIADPRKLNSSHYHFLTYFVAYGEREGKEFLTKIHKNEVQLLENDHAVVAAIERGKADWGVVDSDVAQRAISAGEPLDFSFPDQKEFSTSDTLDRTRGGNSLPTLGVPALPLPLALLKNRPHKKEGRDFVDFFVSPRMSFLLEQKTPGLLSTRTTISTAEAGKSGGAITNPQSLKFAVVSTSEISKINAVFLVSLPLIAGSP